MADGSIGKRWLVLGSVALALAFACEGKSSRGKPGGEAGSANGGASGSGNAGGASGGVSPTGGAPVAGSGAAPSGGRSGTSGTAGDAGAAGDDDGGEGGASGGIGGVAGAVAGSGGVAGVPNGGTGGVSLPACGAVPSGTTIQGCILDAAGAKSMTLAKTPVTVVRIGGGNASGCSTNTTLTTEIRLRAADSREWSYFVYVPDRPLDQVQVGDALDLSVGVSNTAFFFDQTVVLGRGSELVLFSVVSWVQKVPDLSGYGTSVAIGAPYCVGGGICSVTQFHSLLVTRGAENAELQTGQRTTVGRLSVALEVASWGSSPTCDPPTAYRYGGFVPR